MEEVHPHAELLSWEKNFRVRMLQTPFLVLRPVMSKSLPMMPHRRLRLLLPLLTLWCVEARRVRYSLIPYDVVDGGRADKGMVANKMECMMHAINAKSIIFTIESVGDGKKCYIPFDVTSLKERAAYSETYIMDLSNQNDEKCAALSTIDVRKFVKNQEDCDLPSPFCFYLDQFRKQLATRENNEFLASQGFR
uniref:Phosphatidylinositol-glycan biosynthesis class X protein n=1 Tax=Steinernema glaseri TaxID=37863 RepID=A0A1I7YSK2_9BILA